MNSVVDALRTDIGFAKARGARVFLGTIVSLVPPVAPNSIAAIPVLNNRIKALAARTECDAGRYQRRGTGIDDQHDRRHPSQAGLRRLLADGRRVDEGDRCGARSEALTPVMRFDPTRCRLLCECRRARLLGSRTRGCFRRPRHWCRARQRSAVLPTFPRRLVLAASPPHVRDSIRAGWPVACQCELHPAARFGISCGKGDVTCEAVDALSRKADLQLHRGGRGHSQDRKDPIHGVRGQPHRGQGELQDHIPVQPDNYEGQLKAKLQSRYQLQTITMVSEPESGESAGEGKYRFQGAFLQAAPEVVLILEGTNDLIGAQDAATITSAVEALATMVRSARDGARVCLSRRCQPMNGEVFARRDAAPAVPVSTPESDRWRATKTSTWWTWRKPFQ